MRPAVAASAGSPDPHRTELHVTKYGYTALAMIPRKKSSVRIATNEKTNASVAARPTPSAPARQLNPRWHETTAIAAPKKNDFAAPLNSSKDPMYSSV